MQAAAFSANRQLVATPDGNVAKWFDLASGVGGEPWKLPSGASSMTLEPEGRVVAVGEADNRITLRDPRTGRIVRTLGEEIALSVDVAFSADGRTFSTGGNKAGRCGTSLPVWVAEA